MSGKLLFGGLLAVAVVALSSGTASAQWYGGHPGHRGGYYGGGGVVVAPQVVYSRPVYSTPFVSPVYGGGFYSPGFVSRPIYGPVYGGGFAPGFGYGGYGGSFGTVNLGYYRPGFGLNLGFVIR